MNRGLYKIYAINAPINTFCEYTRQDKCDRAAKGINAMQDDKT
jgi:hypothetical protein